MTLCWVLFSVIGFADSLPEVKLQFEKGAALNVEVARTFETRQKGLMYRTTLKKDAGMLFVFERPQKLSFWMKDTYLPLSIAYLDKNKVIKEIHKMKPQSLMEREQDHRSYPSRCICQYALEVNQGWFAKQGIKVGEKVTFQLPSHGPDKSH